MSLRVKEKNSIFWENGFQHCKPDKGNTSENSILLKDCRGQKYGNVANMAAVYKADYKEYYLNSKHSVENLSFKRVAQFCNDCPQNTN